MDATLTNEVQEIYSDIKYYEITKSIATSLEDLNNDQVEKNEVVGYLKVSSRAPLTICLCDINKNHITEEEPVHELKEYSKFLSEIKNRYTDEVKSRFGVDSVDAPTRIEAIVEELKRDYNIRDGHKTWNETYLPYNYEVVDGSLLKTVTKYNRETKETEVFDEVFTSTPFVITSMGRNVDNHNYLVEVSMKDIRDNELQEWITQGELFGRDGIRYLINKGLAFTESKFKDANEYLLDLYNINAKSLPTKIIASSYGWKENRSFFVIGEKAISKDGVSPAMVEGVDDRDIYGTKKGTLDGWVDSVKDLLEYPLARFKCYADCAAPILEITNENSFILHNQAHSGGAKTTTMTCSMSMFTKPEPFTSRSTSKGAALLNEAYPHLPLHFDEVGESPEFRKLIYELVNPNKRATSTEKQVLRSSKRYKTVIQTTGEISLTDEDSYEGEHVRVVPIFDTIPYEPELIKRVGNGINNNYGHVAELYIQKVTQYQDKIREWYEKQFNDLPDYDTAQASRRKGYFAAMIVAGYILEEVFEDIGLSRKNPYEICESFYTKVVKENTFKPYHEQMLQRSYDWFIENINQFVHEEVNEKGHTTKLISGDLEINKRLGWYSDKYIDFIPSTLEGYFNAKNMDISSVYSAWKEDNIIEVAATKSRKGLKARPNKIIGNEKKLVYVIRINREKLEKVLDLESQETKGSSPYTHYEKIGIIRESLLKYASANFIDPLMYDIDELATMFYNDEGHNHQQHDVSLSMIIEIIEQMRVNLN